MDSEEERGVYVWLKTTHVKGRERVILEALRCAIAGDMRWFQLGFVLGDGSTTSDSNLVRSIFVAKLDDDEMTDLASSSSLNEGKLSDMRGAVNGTTGDSDRSNCRPCVLPYPPEGVVWVEDGMVVA